MDGRSLGSAAVMALALSVGALAACGSDGPKFVPPPPAAIGSARVVWRIETPSGAPATCTEVGLESAEVLLGGAPKTVTCGEPEEATFDNLTEGRYAAIVRLKKLGTAVFAEQATNVQVVGGKTTTATVTFSYDPMMGTTGSLLLGWTIDGEDPLTACARVNGATVHVSELSGSRAPFSADVDCRDGEVQLDDLPAGRYGALLLLRDQSGLTINTATVLDVDVVSRETSVPAPAQFRTGTPVLAKLLTEWTVNGVDAATGCAAAGTDIVLVKAIPQPNGMVAAVTATVACSAGRFLAEDVQPGTRPHRVVFQLYENFATFPHVVTSTTVENVRFTRGQTSTVSVDLVVP